MRNEPGLARRIKYFVAAQPRWLSTVIVFLAAIPVIVIVIDTLHGNHYRQDLERLLGDGLERFPIIRSHILRRRSSFGILLV